MDANSVSPPTGAMTRVDSTEASAGGSLKQLSVCQSWFARARSASLWSGGTRLPSGSMLVRTENGVPSPRDAALAISSGPKRVEYATCSASVTGWPRNTSTECASNAARTPA
jgi:hypothetical protein